MKKLLAITLTLFMFFSIPTVMLHSSAESSPYDDFVDVTFNPANGDQSFIYETLAGQCISKPEDPKWKGHVFEGWYNYQASEPFDFNTPIWENLTLTAHWTLEKYTVTFNSNGGNMVEPQTVEYGSCATRPADPTKGNTKFINWYSNPELTQVFDFNTPIENNMTLYAGYETKINETNFPDANFRNYLINNTKHEGTGDSCYYTPNQTASIKELNCSGENISNLEGIKYLTALENLKCQHNNLTDLDVSKNTALTTLLCGYNQLKNLDISNNTYLKVLSCERNQLTSLDVSNKTYFQTLNCFSNQLISLNVNNCTSLTDLVCFDNKLPSLDVSKDTSLRELMCNDNQLTSLNLSNNTALRDLYCANNKLTSLDVSNSDLMDFRVCNQTSEGKIYKTQDGKWAINLKDLDPKLASEMVTINDIDWNYDKNTGIATYNGSDIPENLNYNYAADLKGHEFNVALKLSI